MVGIDVSKGSSKVAIYVDFDQCVQEMTIEHTKSGFQELDDALNSFTNVKIVFESTGVYSRQLERFLIENQFDYVVLNPLVAKLKLNANLRIFKTDKADAHNLAKLMFKEEFDVPFQTAEAYSELQAKSRFYEELEESGSQYRNLLHSRMQQCFPGLEKIFTKPHSDLHLNIVQEFPHPDVVLGYSRTVLKNKLGGLTNKSYSKKNLLERAERLIAVAEECYPSVDVDSCICEQAVYFASKLQEVQRKQKECIDEMIEIAKTLPEFKAILSVSGLGENTTVRLIAEIGDIKRFDKNTQLNAYAGIDIKRVESGTYRKKDRINKRGNYHLRHLLYIIIENMIKQKKSYLNHIVDYYYKQKELYNKCHRVAVVACMNKFLKTIKHLIQKDTYYDYELALSCK